MVPKKINIQKPWTKLRIKKWSISNPHQKIILNHKECQDKTKKQDKTINELLDAKGLICENEQYNKINMNENEGMNETLEEQGLNLQPLQVNLA